MNRGWPTPTVSRRQRRAATDRDELLMSAARRVMRELNAAAVAVFLRVPDTPVLDAAVVAVTPLGTGSVERVSVDDDIYAAAQAFRSDRVATAHSADILANHPNLSVSLPFPYLVAAAPMRSATRRFGTLTVFWLRGDGEANGLELRRLAAAADDLGRDLDQLADAGVSMVPPMVPLVIPADNAGAESSPAASSIAPFVYHLHKLAILLASAVDTQEVVDLAMKRIIHGYRARAAAITLLEADRLRLVAASGCSAEFLRGLNGQRLKSATPETSVIARSRQSVHDPTDPRTRGRLEAGEAEDDDCVWVILPLLAGADGMGTCSIAFDVDDENTYSEQVPLTALATLLGQACERTRMRDAQHALAEKLQDALLPRMLPQPAGVISTSRYMPATGGIELGGDWYDLIKLPSGDVAMVIGDVEGHSTAAAVVMGQLRSAVRAYATEGHGPAAVLARSNQLLVDLDTDLFATCCCVWLDPETGVARIATAGHRAPLFRTADGHYSTPDLDVGTPLGIDRRFDFRVAELSLEPGTLIVLHTNGPAGSGNEITPQALDAALADTGSELESVADHLIGCCDDLTTRHGDDSALLLVRYEGPPVRARRNSRQLEIHRRDLRGAQRARELLREWLADWGLTAMADEAELLMSEIVTNGLVHGDSDVHVYVRRYPGRLRVEVRDSDPRPAQAATVANAEDLSEGGRGLVIVSVIASAWGNSPSGRGKTVWFELPTPGERDATAAPAG